MIRSMPEDGKGWVVVRLDDLPLVVPEEVGGLQVVLLRQSAVDEDSWELGYAAVGRITGDLAIEARNEAGFEYIPRGGSSSGDEGLLVGAQTFAPGLGEDVKSLRLLLSVEELASGTNSERGDLSPSDVAAHWAVRLQSQLAAWSQRDAVVEAVLGATTRSDALGLLSGPPFGFSEAEAAHIVDMSLGLLTGEGDHELREQLAAALSHVQDV